MLHLWRYVSEPSWPAVLLSRAGSEELLELVLLTLGLRVPPVGPQKKTALIPWRKAVVCAGAAEGVRR